LLTWDLLTIVGTIAFAMSGAIVAMEEDYDILGVYILSFVTAFGGGATRNLLIGVPISQLWEQGELFMIALVTGTLIFMLPNIWTHYLKQWTFFDSLGLAAFAIQGAIYAVEMDRPISAVMVAALLTGSGGGLIRDVLAGRKPLIFRDEIYGIWALLGGLLIGLGWGQSAWQLYTLFILIVGLRMASVYYKWKLPKRKVHQPKP
jgi:uncharacterized membrane protein YeiH